jgi:hypothetical protein
MDPVSLVAVVGLVFAGKRISDAKEEQQEVPALLAPQKIFRKDLVQYDQFAQQDMQLDQKNMTPDTGRGFSGDWRLRPKEIAPNMGDIVKDGKRFPFGQPVYDVTYRENVTNKMNNLNPAEKVYVGRGLGLDPNTPAAGGFQQFFRIEPTNMNEETLTTLPGTWGGPASSFIKSGGTTMGEITHHAKQTKAWHRDPAQNRGQGQGGAITAPEGRPDFQKTRRTTNRQETGYRDDNLGDGPAQFSVGQGYNSGLLNNGMSRSSDNRVNPDRAANAGRMNVRQDPIGMIGAGTTTRLEASSLPLRPADGSHGQRYIVPQYQKVNVFKGNTIQTDFGLARDVRAKNPIAQPAFVDYAKA